mmetsp:Transcript_53734/g.117243  ORF Transcript_53734/g.117243 Transcript_53734/m.117243 type:complete len:314 (+) Transcript_53734:450-1391(+)
MATACDDGSGLYHRPHCDQTLREWLDAGPYTLVMSSSFLGAFAHAGVLAALAEAEVSPSAVSGASAGAWVAALFAAGVPIKSMVTIFTRIVQRLRFAWAVPWRERGGLLSTRAQSRLISDELAAAGAPSRLEECAVPVSISTFDLQRFCAHPFSHGAIGDVVSASAAVPALFTPAWLDGSAHADGFLGDVAGLAGVGTAQRVLYNHHSIVPLSATRISHFAASVTLRIYGLPWVHPFNVLRVGKRTYVAAKHATLSALAQPLTQSPKAPSGSMSTMRCEVRVKASTWPAGLRNPPPLTSVAAPEDSSAHAKLL